MRKQTIRSPKQSIGDIGLVLTGLIVLTLTMIGLVRVQECPSGYVRDINGYCIEQ